MSFDADAIVDRRRLRRRLSFWRVLAVLGLLTGLIALGLVASGDRFGLRGAHIARYSVSGFIAGGRSEIETLDRMANNNGVRAVVVRIDSPGGTTAGAEALYGALRRIAAKKPVVAVVGTMAASGGYIAALGTDRIVARRNSLVGSVGVLYQWPEVTGLLGEIGVKVNEVKSAPLKAAPNPFEPATPEAVAVLQDLVRDAYGWFLGLVAERRNLSADEAGTVGSGRIFTGNQAVPLKLVDQIGGEEDAIAWLAASRGIDRGLPVRDWRPRNDGLGVDFATRVLVWLLNKAGIGSLAGWLPLGGAPLGPAGSLDGLLSLWQAPGTDRGAEMLRAAP